MSMARALPVFIAALIAAPAFAQTEDAQALSMSRPAQAGEFSPFLTPGFDPPLKRPRDGLATNADKRGVGSAHEFDFDKLMAPGARGSKRSMRPGVESVLDSQE
ncbi:MAG: hypothetical protein WD969_12495 [Paracoccaceae bacterium]